MAEPIGANFNLRSFEGFAYHTLFKAHVRPAILGDAPGGDDTKLVLHVRSGDVFQGSGAGARRYVQPPLAFYVLSIAHALAHRPIRTIHLVYEDRANPTVAALEAHLATLPVPSISQSSSLTEDVQAIFNANTVIAGVGTFAPTIAAQNPNIAAIYFFRLPYFANFFGPATAFHVVDDVAGGFTPIGSWRNTPAQKQLMIDYGAENLALRTHGAG